jgi:hypothetical protein
VRALGSSLLVLVSVGAALMFVVGVGGAHAQPALVLPGLNCGIGGPTSQLVPLVLRNKAGHPIPPQSYPFAAACKKHDQCYAHWGMDRGSCDQVFGLDMHAVCQLQPGAARADCEYVGEEYHSAVVRKGAAAYKEAQQGTLVAALSGVYTGIAGRLVITGGANGTVTLPWRGKVTITSIGDNMWAKLEVTSPVEANDTVGSEIGHWIEHPTSVTGAAPGCGFDPPDGYVGGAIGCGLVVQWGGGILPPTITGTFSGVTLPANVPGNADGTHDLTFSGSFRWTKSHR